MDINERRKHQWYYGIPASCEVCGKAFGALRVTAQYCSDRCKQKAYRDAKKKKKEAEKHAKRRQMSLAIIYEQGG